MGCGAHGALSGSRGDAHCPAVRMRRGTNWSGVRRPIRNTGAEQQRRSRIWCGKTLTQAPRACVNADTRIAVWLEALLCGSQCDQAPEQQAERDRAPHLLFSCRRVAIRAGSLSFSLLCVAPAPNPGTTVGAVLSTGLRAAGGMIRSGHFLRSYSGFIVR